jgi:hypothetical protein
MAEPCFSSKKNGRAGVDEILSDGKKLSVTEYPVGETPGETVTYVTKQAISPYFEPLHVEQSPYFFTENSDKIHYTQN